MTEHDTNGLWAVVPAFNEEKVLSQTLERLRAVVPNIVIVDDCSTDNTAAVAQGCGVDVVRHPVNLGQGAALQTGMDYALKKGAQYIVSFDADGQHDANAIPTMLDMLREGNEDIILGSRFLGGAYNIPKARRVILQLAIWLTRMTSGVSFTDVHNGLRLMSRDFATRFRFTQDRMAHASEILNYIGKNNIRFKECPVTVYYTDYTLEKGQQNSNAFSILFELIIGYLFK